MTHREVSSPTLWTTGPEHCWNIRIFLLKLFCNIKLKIREVNLFFPLHSSINLYFLTKAKSPGCSLMLQCCCNEWSINCSEREKKMSLPFYLFYFFRCFLSQYFFFIVSTPTESSTPLNPCTNSRREAPVLSEYTSLTLDLTWNR